MHGTKVTGGSEPVRVYNHCLPKGFDRPSAYYRLDAVDQGRILRHGDGPDGCDAINMREPIVFEHDSVFYLHYDACESRADYGHTCLATSNDLVHWKKQGTVLAAGAKGCPDWAGVCSPWLIREGETWHMFYIGSHTRGRQGREVLASPYLTMKAMGQDPAGPWTKQYDVIPFRPQPETYYAVHASPGHIVKSGDEYVMFFFCAISVCGGVLRSLSIARTRDLNGPWTVDPEPIVPMTEQIENSSLYFEEANQTWFLFTNHIGSLAVSEGWGDYTDAVWVYWSKDLNRWDSRNKAVVLDGRNCAWASENIGMPSVVKVGNRLAMFYDAREGAEISHFNRDIGLAWLDLPLIPPEP